MKNRYILVLAAMGFAFGLSAQITIKGKISNIPARGLQVALVDHWSVDRWRQLAILQLEDGGNFSTQVTMPNQAQCRIRLAGRGGSTSDFILPGPGEPSDSVITFDLDAEAMNGGPIHIGGYPENELYFTLMSASKKLEDLRNTPATDPATLQSAILELNQLCTKTSQANRGTFTGDVVANLLYTPQKSDYAKDPKVASMGEQDFLMAHALDKIPFYSEKVLYHIGFAQALYHYYEKFDRSAADSGVQFIEGIMSKRNGSEPVDLYLFKYLMDKMVDEKDEASLQHLLKWYPPDCSEGSALPDFTKTMVEALKFCEPGNVIPELSWNDPNGTPVSLSSVCEKNKMTLLLFWKTNCSHCTEFKPVLAGLYEQYHGKGLEVYAISLDRVEQIWRKNLELEPSPWMNVYAPWEEREFVSHHFPIPSTPTLIALDKDRKVLSRLIVREQLGAYLGDVLRD